MTSAPARQVDVAAPPSTHSGLAPFTRWILVWLVTLAAVLGVAAAYYGLIAGPADWNQHVAEARRELATIADFRRVALDRTIATAFTDAGLISAFPSVLDVATAHERREPHLHVDDVLRAFLRVKPYLGALIVSADGSVLVSSGADVLPDCIALGQQVARSGHRQAAVHAHGTRVHIAVAVPMVVDAATRGSIVLESDGATFGYLAEERQTPLGPARSALVGWSSRSRVPIAASDPSLTNTTLEASRDRDLTAGSPPRIVAVRWSRLAPVAAVVAISESQLHAAVDPDLRARELAVGAALAFGTTLLFAIGWARVQRYEARIANERLGRAVLLDHMQDAVFIIGLDGRIREVNARVEELYGYRRAELRGAPMVSITGGERASTETPGATDVFDAVVRSGSAERETRHRRANGTFFPVDVAARRVDAAGEQVIVAVVRDITARKAAEARMERLNRFLLTSTEMHQAIARAPSREELFDRCCRIAVDEGAFLLAWIGRAEPDGRMVPVAAAGPTERLTEQTVRWDETLHGRGLVGTAIRDRRAVAIDDIRIDERAAPWRQALDGTGIGSAVAAPIATRTSVFGALGLGASEPHYFDRLTLRHVERLAGEIGFALQAFEDRAERQAAADALAEQKRLFERMTELTPAILYLLDWDRQKVIYVNEAVRSVLGYSPEAILASDIRDVATGDDPDLAEQHDLWRSRVERANDGEVVEREYRMPDAFGGFRWLASREVVFGRSADGRVKTLLGVTQDVTARITGEQALAREAERYRTLLNTSLEGIHVIDLDGNLIEANAAFYQMLGYAPHAGAPRNVREWDPSLLDDQVRPLLEELFRARGTTLTRENRCADGSTIDVEIGVTGVDFGSGPLLYCASRDITARVGAQEALRRSEERFRAVFDQAAIGIAICALDGAILQANPALLSMLEYTAEEITGMSFVTLTHPDDLASEMPLVDAVRSGESDGFTIEKRYIARSGRTVRAILRITTVRDNAGRLAYVLGMVDDVTEQRALEERFQHAQKMESIGRLAGGVAHDFNNLLTAIIGYAELLRADLPGDHPGQPFIDEVLRAGTRATALTSQLLAFARRQVITPRAVDLNTIVTETERMLRRLIGEDVQLVLDLAPDLGIIDADPGQVQQVLMNLLVNARDAMPGGGAVTITTRNMRILDHASPEPGLPDSGEYVVLTFSDTGTGMTADVQQHLFEPFFTTKERGKGTGLGLATCHGIVTQAGGSIQVASQVGVGTTFTIYFPRSRRALEKESEKAAPAVRGGTETILLAEDEPAVRSLAARSLRSFGYTVLDAADGREALAIAREHGTPIHLLITDVVMPGMNGPELAGQFRALRPGVPVLFISGYADRPLQHDAATDARLAFLPKPFTPERLVRRVRDVLDAV